MTSGTVGRAINRPSRVGKVAAERNLDLLYDLVERRPGLSIVDAWRVLKGHPDCTWKSRVSIESARSSGAMGRHGIRSYKEKLKVTLWTEPDFLCREFGVAGTIYEASLQVCPSWPQLVWAGDHRDLDRLRVLTAIYQHILDRGTFHWDVDLCTYYLQSLHGFTSRRYVLSDGRLVAEDHGEPLKILIGGKVAPLEGTTAWKTVSGPRVPLVVGRGEKG